MSISSPGAFEPNPYLPGYKESHIKNHTWRTAENSAAHLLPRLQALAAEKPNLQLLDFGCGVGTITASLAKYMPQGRITAFDICPEIVGRAEKHARDQGITNITFGSGCIFELPLHDNYFDVVHAHQVLCHLNDPLRALRIMLRVTRPGGTIALRESDLRMWNFCPELQGLLEFHDVVMTCMTAAGGSISLGAGLVSLAMQAGVPRTRIEASMGTWCYSTRAEREMWGGAMRERIRDGEIRTMMLKRGRKEDNLDSMADAWTEWIEAEDACFGCMHGQLLITK